MRVEKVTHGHRWREKLILGAMRLVTGRRAPDVVRTIFYRSDFFGKRHALLTHRVMRGDSEWSVAERELFAAFVSRLNRCPF